MAPTAIVTPVSEAEPLLGPWRRAHTADGAAGMPPHVTLLYPFVDDNLLSAAHLAGLAAVAATVAPWDVELARFGSFDGPPRALYLEPEPAAPFVQLIAGLAAAFPDFPPYGGAFETVVPHLTVVQTDNETVHTSAAHHVAPHLPITASVEELWVMEHHPAEGWRRLHGIDLGGRTPVALALG